MRKIRILHHMARTGGTVISRCLGTMRRNVLLSEIHPLGSQVHNPLQQAVEWHHLYDASELAALGRTCISFVDTIRDIESRVASRSKLLILRDWSHLDFTGVPYMKDRYYRSRTVETLSKDFNIVSFATVRHPLDQWQSLSRLEPFKGIISLEEFMTDCRHFAAFATSCGFVKYEEFLRDPDNALRGICEGLEIEYDSTYADNWHAYNYITGDLPSLDRKAINHGQNDWPPRLLEQCLENEDYLITLGLLGYEHPGHQ